MTYCCIIVYIYLYYKFVRCKKRSIDQFSPQNQENMTKICTKIHDRVLNLLNRDFYFEFFGGQKGEGYLCSTVLNRTGDLFGRQLFYI